jgi:hypothetical protein
MRIIKGLGFVFLPLALLCTLGFSEDIGSMSNNATAMNITSVNPSASIADASCHASAIMPLSSRPGGLTYGEWNAKWWQWAYSLPVNAHPLFDTADCSQGQSGNVWFLGSSFATEQGPSGEVIAKVDRTCNIPRGKMLFFPVMNVEGSPLEGNGETEAELRDYTNWIMDHAIDMSAEIDGCPVRNLEQYLAPSPQFTFGPLPENNVLQWLGIDAPAETTSISVANGIYLMLAPLSIGKHTIHFEGTFKFTQDPDGFDFVFKQDVNYEITVKPNWQPPRMFMAKNMTRNMTQLVG